MVPCVIEWECHARVGSVGGDGALSADVGIVPAIADVQFFSILDRLFTIGRYHSRELHCRDVIAESVLPAANGLDSLKLRKWASKWCLSAVGAIESADLCACLRRIQHRPLVPARHLSPAQGSDRF
jgi:hypothetical protein